MSEIENQNEEVLNDVSTGEEHEQPEVGNESPELDISVPDEEEKDLTELPLPDEEDDISPEQRKINDTIKLVRLKERKKYEAKEAQLMAQLQQIQMQQLPYGQQMQNIPAANMEGAPPDRDAFDNEQEYIGAVVKYNINQERIREAAIQQQAALKKQYDDYFNTLNKVKDSGSLKYEDFDETVSPLMTNFQIDDIVKKAILKSEFAPDLLYFMGRNLEQSNKLTRMDPIDAVKKINEMEMRFKEAKKKKVNPGSFQPPVNLKSQSARMGTPDAKEVDNMTPAQYAEWRRKVSSGSSENKWSR